MLMQMGLGWLATALAVVAIISFIISMGLDAVMGRESLGPAGNAFVMTTGFFGAILAANMWGYRLTDIQFAALAGVCGAFGALTLCAFAKGVLSRW